MDCKRGNLGGLHALELLDAGLLVGGLGRDRADHAAVGEGGDAVRAHAVALHVERDRLGQADDAELRGRVVGLAEVADQARGRGHVHVAARLLRAEVRRGGARDVERAVQVHVDHRAPFLDGHVEEEAVAQDSCVVHHHIELLKRIHGTLHDAIRRFPLGDAVGACHGLAARGADLVRHLFRRAGVAALAVDRGADVVHHDRGARGAERQREIAADAAPGAGDERDLALEELQSRKPG